MMAANSSNTSEPLGAAGSADLLSAPVHSMGRLLQEHQAALAAVCVASLVLGGPLAGNLLWHLQVRRSTEVSLPPAVVVRRSSQVNGLRFFLTLSQLRLPLVN